MTFRGGSRRCGWWLLAAWLAAAAAGCTAYRERAEDMLAHLRIGMTMAEVVERWGNPERTDVRVTRQGEVQTWSYIAAQTSEISATETTTTPGGRVFTTTRTRPQRQFLRLEFRDGRLDRWFTQ